MPASHGRGAKKGPPARATPGKLNDGASGPALDLLARTHRRSGQPEVFGFRAHGTVDGMLKTELVSECSFLQSFPFSEATLAQVRLTGLAIHEGRPIGAGQSGEVEILVVEDQAEKEMSNEQWKAEGTSGPAAGSREGQRARSQAAPDPARSFVGPRRPFYQSQLASVRAAYPGTKCRGEKSGIWFVVPAFPAGRAGPQATFLIAIPDNRKAPILTWAFWSGTRQAAWIGHRHTNYPCGSVCAFPIHGGFWSDGDPMVRYIDRLCEWGSRHLFLHVAGYWPGPQDSLGQQFQSAAARYYRLSTGLPHELCFCGKGGEYFDCCRDLDLEKASPSDRASFMENCSNLDIGEQKPDQMINRFAIGVRRKLPVMKRVHPWLSGQTAESACV